MTEAASFKHKKLPSSALMIGLADIVIIIVVGYLYIFLLKLFLKDQELLNNLHH